MIVEIFTVFDRVVWLLGLFAVFDCVVWLLGIFVQWLIVWFGCFRIFLVFYGDIFGGCFCGLNGRNICCV